MKILVFTNYFPPELGAASNRMLYLTKGLKQCGHEVEVVAPLPNYPKGVIYDGYKSSFKVKEKIDGIPVNRFWIYATVSKNSLLRLLAMVSFALSFWTGIFYYIRKKPDCIIVQHSPLIVSFAAMVLAKFLPGCRKILNVSDLWPRSALELGVIDDGGILFTVMEKMEYFNYRNAHLIMGQSNEILQHVEERSNKALFLYRNIIPLHTANGIQVKKYHKQRPKIIYAGLLGVAQGVSEICKSVSFKKLGVEFHIYGGGNEEGKINNFVKKNGDSNVFFHGSVPKEELHKILPKFHASIVPLVNRIYGAVPSKIYELISFGVPILFCGEGEAADIIAENNVGFISGPRKYKQLEKNISVLRSLTEKEYQTILLNCHKMVKNELDYQDQINRLDYELDNLKSL